MILATILDEITDTYSVTMTEFPKDHEYVAEAFIKDNGFIWYAVLRYSYEPTLSTVMRETYALRCKSPRPYKPAQPCDGSITAPVFHLYNQLCKAMSLDPLAIYQQAYDDSIFTNDQLSEIRTFAEWQGVETIHIWNMDVIEKVLESIREVNMHQLANLLEELIPL